MYKRRILVTGGLGHIGSKLIREYGRRTDVEMVRVLDNLSMQRYCSLFNLPKNMGYEFVEGDINEDFVLRKSLEGIDTIVHLAAITDAPATLNRRDETFRVNLEGTRMIIQAAVEAGAQKFLFPSSTSVYGETEGLVDETFTGHKPSTPYAESKLEAEKVVSAFGKTGKIDTRILRMGTIFGASIGMRMHTAVNKFSYLAALNRPVTIWRNAYEQKRPYLGINDDIRAFEFLEQNGRSGEVYNILTQNYTVKQVLEAIKRFVPDLKIEWVDSPIINQKSYEVSNRKMKDLGFEFRDDLEALIGETLALFKQIKNPN